MGLISVIQPTFILSGFVVGVLVGQTGVGGGSLMTPLLVLLFGIHPASAVGTDLLYAAATKSVGTLVHGFNRTVDWRITGLLAAGSVPATLVTLLAISHFDIASPGSGRIITAFLAVMLFITALSLLFRKSLLTRFGPRLAHVEMRRADELTVAAGIMLGVLVTMTSVGAGALGMPILMLLYPRKSMAVLVGSDIAHAVPLTLVAGIGHWWLGSVDVPLLISLLIGSVPGVILGSYLTGLVSDQLLRRVLGTVLAVVAIRLVF